MVSSQKPVAYGGHCHWVFFGGLDAITSTLHCDVCGITNIFSFVFWSKIGVLSHSFGTRNPRNAGRMLCRPDVQFPCPCSVPLPLSANLQQHAWLLDHQHMHTFWRRWLAGQRCRCWEGMPGQIPVGRHSWHFESWCMIYSYFDFGLKNSSFRLPYQRHCSREMFKGSNRSASVLIYTRKKNFWLVGAEFLWVTS